MWGVWMGMGDFWCLVYTYQQLSGPHTCVCLCVCVFWPNVYSPAQHFIGAWDV